MGKFKKYSRYKNLNNNYLPKIPEHWLFDKYKTVFIQRKQKNHDKNALLLSLFTHIGVRPRSQMEEKGNKAVTVIGYSIVKKEDLIVNKLLAWMGAIAKSNYNGVTSPDYDVYELINKDFNSNYFHYLCRSKYFIGECYRYGRGIMMMRHRTYPQQLKNIYIPIPPIEEQNKIVGFIEYKEKQINKLIKKQKKLIELLEEKKKIIITEAVTKGMDKSVSMKDSGIDYIGQIPQNWEVIKLKFISLCNKYSLDEQTDKNRQINYVDIGSVTNKDGITNVQKMLFKEAPSRARRIIHTNDTIISTVRTYLKAIAYIDEKYDNHICSTGFAVITPKNNIDPKFLFYILHSENFICKVERISTGANYPAITANKLINLKCLMPSLQEQKNIIKYIENIEVTINKLIENKNNLINKLEEYKKSLISFAVTGQIDVRDYEIPKTDDDVDLEEIENISEDDTETISEVEYANN